MKAWQEFISMTQEGGKKEKKETPTAKAYSLYVKIHSKVLISKGG